MKKMRKEKLEKHAWMTFIMSFLGSILVIMVLLSIYHVVLPEKTAKTAEGDYLFPDAQKGGQVKSCDFRKLLEDAGATGIVFTNNKLAFELNGNPYQVETEVERDKIATVIAFKWGDRLYETDPMVSFHEDTILDTKSGFTCSFNAWLWLKHIVADGVKPDRDPLLAGNTGPDHTVYFNNQVVSRIVSGQEMVIKSDTTSATK